MVVGCMSSCHTQKLTTLKKFRSNVPEPSDIVYNTQHTGFYIVSDQGFLYETDTLGRITRKALHTGTDFEGVFADNEFIYVTDERTRRILVYDAATFDFIKQFEVSYNGASNEAYEGITFNTKKNCYVLAIEKNPVSVVELSTDFRKLGEFRINHISDISSICYHENFLYILSDEDQEITKLDPSDYTTISKWKIPVTNPEGMCFDDMGNVIILSDKDQKIYRFNVSSFSTHL